MNNELPSSPSCQRNSPFILEKLKEIIQDSDQLLTEIGSGTGEHAVFMAKHFPKLIWQTTDLKENHLGINQWIEESKIENIRPPIEYVAGKTPLPGLKSNIVFTANTLHIMSWKNCKTLFKHLSSHLLEGGSFVAYGPFNYQGSFTSESNKLFNLSLKERNAESGIRNFEDICKVLEKHQIHLTSDLEMPANNRLLHFTKITKIIN